MLPAPSALQRSFPALNSAVALASGASFAARVAAGCDGAGLTAGGAGVVVRPEGRFFDFFDFFISVPFVPGGA